MLNKKNSKVLWVIFVVLLALWLILRYTDKSNNTLKEELVQVDTAQVDRISIKTPHEHTLQLVRSGKSWQIETSYKKYHADIRKIHTLLTAVKFIKPLSEVSDLKKDWPKYEVGDSLGTHVQLYSGSKRLANLIVGLPAYIPAHNTGRPSYMNRARGEMISYIRNIGDSNTYTVEGMWRTIFTAHADDYRSRVLFHLDKNKITEINFIYPKGQKFKLQKTGKQWKLDGQITDSTATARYLNRYSYAYGNHFANAFNATDKKAAYQIEISGKHLTPVIIQAFVDAKGKKIIHANTNEAFFDASKGSLFKRYFVGKASFFKHKKQKE